MLSSLTYKEFEAQVRGLCGATNYENPNTTTMMRWTNMVIQKMARLLAPIDKPWGRTTSTLTMLLDVGKFIGVSQGTYSALTLTKTGASFDATYVGGWAFVHDATTPAAFYGLIDRLGATSDSVILRFLTGTTSAPSSISTGNLTAIIKPNPVFYNGANHSLLNILDPIKYVDGTNGNVVRLAGDVFADFEDNPNYEGSVVGEYAGEASYISKGSGVSTLGTITFKYDEKPAVITAVSDLIDMRPEHHQMLLEEVTRYCYAYQGKPIPSQYQNPLRELEESYKHSRTNDAVKTQVVPVKRSA